MNLHSYDLNVAWVETTSLLANPRNARVHTKSQIKAIAQSIKEFGWTNPIIVDGTENIVAGHARWQAAKMLGVKEVPIIRRNDMSEQQVRAYCLADNRLAELAGWDQVLLAEEFQGLLAGGFDLGITGFDMAEVDRVLGLAGQVEEEQLLLPPPSTAAVSQPGDVWNVGRHFIACGDARDSRCYERLLAGELAEMVFTDPPYNVPIAGNVSGLGRHKHREFLMGSGELSPAQHVDLLQRAMQSAAASSIDGAIHYVCMDWRHLDEMSKAAKGVYSTLLNLCVWVKTNAGMGCFYRSQHELVFVFKVGTAKHINNFGLGEKGRYRTNVWTYSGVNCFREGRAEDLAAHPTIKPVAMVADAILDCSRRGGIVLDPFAGSGSTLLAAEKTGRRGYGIELDPVYVDLCVRRLEEATGCAAVHEDGETFAALALQRASATGAE